jgi:hypothetical protein
MEMLVGKTSGERLGTQLHDSARLHVVSTIKTKVQRMLGGSGAYGI